MDAVSGQSGIGEVVGENVGVGVNHAKQIVDGVGNDFGARRRMCGVFAEVEIHVPSPFELQVAFSFRE